RRSGRYPPALLDALAGEGARGAVEADRPSDDQGPERSQEVREPASGLTAAPSLPDPDTMTRAELVAELATHGQKPGGRSRAALAKVVREQRAKAEQSPGLFDRIEAAADAAIEAAEARRAGRRIPRGRDSGASILAEEIVDAAI